MSVALRVATGSVANLAGIGMNAVLQLLTVPILVAAWGQERFGLWVMLTTIPTYFALTDLGFVQSATADMTMKNVRGEREDVLATFQSVSLLFVGSSAAIFALSSLLLVPGTLTDRLKDYWIIQNADVVVLLVGYAAGCLLSQVTLAGFRSTGNYAVGTLSLDTMGFLEGLIALLAAHSGAGFQGVVLTLITIRFTIIAVHYALLRATVPWLYYGVDHARFIEIKRLSKSALSALAIPVALAINLQGVVLVVGAVLSPASVAIYTSVRTASRLAIQLTGVVNRATMPEIGRAAGASAVAAMSKLLSMNLYLVLFVLAPGGMAFALFGQDFVTIWSRGHIIPSQTFIEIMAMAMVVHGCWYFASNVLLATNAHSGMAKYLLGASVLSLLVVVVFAKHFGLVGVAVGVTLSEFINAAAVLWKLTEKRAGGENV